MITLLSCVMITMITIATPISRPQLKFIFLIAFCVCIFLIANQHYGRSYFYINLGSNYTAYGFRLCIRNLSVSKSMRTSVQIAISWIRFGVPKGFFFFFFFFFFFNNGCILPIYLSSTNSIRREHLKLFWNRP